MKKSKGTVFCIEGMNRRIRKLISRFDEDQMSRVRILCQEAEKMLDFNLMEFLDSEMEEESYNVEIAFSNLVLTYIADYTIFETYISKGLEPDVLIGYSLGLNTAMVCAGYLTFEGGIDILKCIRKCLQYASMNLDRDMALVVGLSIDTVKKYIHENNWDEYVSIGSVNSDYSLLLTGEKTYVEKVMLIAREQGALKAVMIDTFMAFHYEKREKWLEECIAGIDALELHKGKYAILSVYSLTKLEENEESIKTELKENVYRLMRWSETLKKLENEGYHKFWDVSLDGNLKKISALEQDESKFYTYKSLKKLEKILSVSEE